MANMLWFQFHKRKDYQLVIEIYIWVLDKTRNLKMPLCAWKIYVVTFYSLNKRQISN